MIETGSLVRGGWLARTAPGDAGTMPIDRLDLIERQRYPCAEVQARTLPTLWINQSRVRTLIRRAQLG